MLKVGEDELICDLAETYGIFNYKELSPYLVATLSLGLRDNSRIKRKLSNSKINSMEELLIAKILDDIEFLCWTKTKDAQHNKNRPKSILDKLLGKEENKKDDLKSFETPEEYEEYMFNIRGFRNG